jgi:hypothetical protein
MTSLAEQIPQGTPQANAPAPAYTLFDAGAVTIATFFGTAVAGGILMAINYRRLGEAGKAVATLIAAIVVTGLALLVGFNTPQSASSVIGILLVLLIARIAKSMQGQAIADHVQRGGQLGSRWRAFFLGILILALVFGGVFAVIYAKDNKPKITIGSSDDVYYAGSATKEDAQALGNALKTSGYFSDKGAADVILTKGGGGTTVAFIVKEGFWNDPAHVASFEIIGQQIAPLIGGFPIQVQLLNKSNDVESTSSVGQSAFNNGKDHIYFLGSATADQAQSLGQALISDGFLSGKGADVFLSKHSDGTVLSFIVGDGVWNDPKYVSGFETITRGVAPSIGGLPVRLRLVSTSFETQKDEVLN